MHRDIEKVKIKRWYSNNVEKNFDILPHFTKSRQNVRTLKSVFFLGQRQIVPLANTFSVK